VQGVDGTHVARCQRVSGIGHWPLTSGFTFGRMPEGGISGGSLSGPPNPLRTVPLAGGVAVQGPRGDYRL
jgi:hypothetical protein